MTNHLLTILLILSSVHLGQAQKVVYKVLQDQIMTEGRKWSSLGSNVTTEEVIVHEDKIELRDKRKVVFTAYFEEMEKEYTSPRNYSLKFNTGEQTFVSFCFAKDPSYAEDRLYMYITALNVADEGKDIDIIHLRSIFVEDLVIK